MKKYKNMKHTHEIEDFLRRDYKKSARKDYLSLALFVILLLVVAAFMVDQFTSWTTITPVAHADYQITEIQRAESSFCSQARVDHASYGVGLQGELLELCGNK
jgi:hypothetical protein